MLDLARIAQDADLIVDGYAFTKNEHEIESFNLNDGSGVAVFDCTGRLIETNMGDIELSIVQKYLFRNLLLLES